MARTRRPPAKNTRFGAFGVYTPSSAPNHSKRRFLRPLPHAGDKCSCSRCDAIRIENAGARRTANWPDDYPPAFYSRVKRNSTDFYGPRYVKLSGPSKGPDKFGGWDF